MSHMFKRLEKRIPKLNYVGIIFGLMGYFAALTPSLMPRPAVFMGVVAGVGFVLWYGVGVVLSGFVRRHKLLLEPKRDVKRQAWIALGVAVPVFVGAVGLLTRLWQNEQRVLLDQPTIAYVGVLTIAGVAIAVATVLFAIVRMARWGYGQVRGQLKRVSFIPPYIGGIVALVIFILLVVSVMTGLLQRTVVVMIDATYSANNNQMDPSLKQPSSELRSGSAASAATWEGLGHQGRRFVATGPDAADISRFTHTAAKEPIRVYAGINNASGREQQVTLAMKELERTHAFDRKVLGIVTPTGTGWVESETVAAIEYMHDGDTALVTAQYSYLPSGFSFVIDRGDAQAMARELLHAVENRLREMPKETRPKLIAYGLSLGSYGGQADFTGEADFAHRLDGGLFVGTPGFSEPWRTITRDRDKGSSQVSPVYHDERIIKFATSSSDIINDINPPYKIVYYQYATDPFVWFDASLLYSRPDWLRETPGRGVTPRLAWYPVITFLQVAIDQIFALTLSGDNGHDYSHDTVAAVAATTHPQDWSAEKTRRLQDVIAPAASR